ncbi:hypothetical protein WHR41_06536 [Cladosporium halotolerans]|uniref:Sugar phosphate transporter domain-containing protein n=1 Tax=Cladosporium halotolerans TaxID=1052096 RepID=A0AB34KN13_9PEZI
MGEPQPSLSHPQPTGLSPDNTGSDSYHSLRKSDEDTKDSLDSSSSGLTSTLLQGSPELEAQVSSLVQDAPENQVPRGTKIIFIALYLFLNLSLTLSNKSVLSQLSLPWLLTVSHTTATSIGTFALMGTGYLNLTPLSLRSHLTLLAFSILFTLNIAISNVSLAMVSVPFHQIMRSTCPVVTILLYRTIYSRSYNTGTYVSIVPLVLGAGLATAGDYQASGLGFLLTLLGVFLACIKTIATNRLMTGPLDLSAMELLLRMSPLAAIQCMAYAALTGELSALRRFTQLDGGFTWSLSIALLLNACVAFALNVISFQTNKLVGALAVTVCGNVKQALTILLGIVVFSVPIGVTNATGMFVTMMGAAWFSKVELDNKASRLLGGT